MAFFQSTEMLLIVGFALLLLAPKALGHVKQPTDESVSQVDPLVFPTKVPQVVKINFDVAKGNYVSFLSELRGVLVDNSAHKAVAGVPFLPPQQVDRQPARWIHVNLSGRNAETTTILMRDDNMYMVGFTNCTGDRYVFSDNQNLMPGATVIPLKDNYGSLLGVRPPVKGHKELPKYQLAPQVSVGQISGTVSQGWDWQTHIDDLEADRLVLWGKASYALLNWEKTGRWVDKSHELESEGKIPNQQTAIEVLAVALLPKAFTFGPTVDPNDITYNATCN